MPGILSFRRQGLRSVSMAALASRISSPPAVHRWAAAAIPSGRAAVATPSGRAADARAERKETRIARVGRDEIQGRLPLCISANRSNVEVSAKIGRCWKPARFNRTLPRRGPVFNTRGPNTGGTTRILARYRPGREQPNKASVGLDSFSLWRWQLSAVFRVIGSLYCVLCASLKPSGNHVPFVYVGHTRSGLLEDIFSRLPQMFVGLWVFGIMSSFVAFTVLLVSVLLLA